MLKVLYRSGQVRVSVHVRWAEDRSWEALGYTYVPVSMNVYYKFPNKYRYNIYQTSNKEKN
jgi:hypothetical protein